MSGNKMTDVKNTEDLNVDSGFQSGGGVDFDEDGFLSGVGADFEEASEAGDFKPEVVLDVPPKSDEKKVSSVVKGESGIVSDDICFMLDEMNLDPTTEDDVKIEHTILRPQATDLPLDLLFQQDDDGDTQLHIAAVQGYRKPVTTLIRICPNKELLNVCNDYGQTPLHLAVMGKDPVITRMLVLAGADIGIRDRRGDTPLHKATALANIECMQALLIPVQDQPRKTSTVLNQKNYSGRACVHLAATHGSMEALQILLFYGADINSMENLGGWTALHIAAHRGDARMVSQLQRSASLAARPLNYAGRSPRRLARARHVADLFTRHEDSDDDTDDDEDMFDEEIENIFEIYSKQQIVA